MTTEASSEASRSWRDDISRYQWSVLVATTLGWTLDGFDSSLFTQVAGPATTDLLGHRSTVATGLAVTLFLTGWAVGAIAFGALADYVGRVRVLMAGILLYAVFTGLSALAPTYELFVACRFVAGVGSGVELPIGAALVAEAWNNRHRAKAAGTMMSGIALGSLLAALVYGLVGVWGWRPTLAFGILPALLVIYVRRHVHEPESSVAMQAARRERRQARAAGAPPEAGDRFVLLRLVTPPLLGRTVGCTLICIGALFAFWGLTTWTPDVARAVAVADGASPADTVSAVAWAVAALNLGGVAGYVSWGFVADRIGRRPTFLASLLIGIVGVLVTFPVGHSYVAFVLLLPLCSFGMFGVLSGTAVFFPELFGPSVRASAMAVTNSVGRLFTAAGPLMAGAIATGWFGGSLAAATTVVCLLAVVSFAGLAMLPETRGRFVHAEDPGGDVDPPATATVRGTV